MRFSFKFLRSHALLVVLGALPLILFCASAALVFVWGSRLSSPLVLHFTPLSGVDLFGAPRDLWYFAGFAGLVVFVNSILAYVFFHRERIFSYLLLVAAIIVTLFIFVVVSVTLSVN